VLSSVDGRLLIAQGDVVCWSLNGVFLPQTAFAQVIQQSNVKCNSVNITERKNDRRMIVDDT